MQKFSEYRRMMSAQAQPVLRAALAQQPDDDSVLLGAPAAAQLLEHERAQDARFVESFRALSRLGKLADPPHLADPGGHRRAIYHPLVLHLHLAAFGKLYEVLEGANWSSCEDAIPGAVEPARACEEYTDAPPPAQVTDVMLWQALCILEQAVLLKRDIDAEWADGVVHQVVNRPGPGDSLHPQTQGESLDAWTFRELCGLHALANLALLMKRPAWGQRVRQVAEYHQQRTQPDHVTTQPWGFFAFACRAETRDFAEQQLHDAKAQGGTDAVTALLLADGAWAIDQHSLNPKGLP